MASATINDEVTCPLCLDLYSDPRLLPCYHTFCSGCIGQLIEKSCKENDKTFSCPLWRTSVLVNSIFPVNVYSLKHYLKPLLLSVICVAMKGKFLRIAKLAISLCAKLAHLYTRKSMAVRNMKLYRLDPTRELRKTVYVQNIQVRFCASIVLNVKFRSVETARWPCMKPLKDTNYGIWQTLCKIQMSGWRNIASNSTFRFFALGTRYDRYMNAKVISMQIWQKLMHLLKF